MCFDDFRVSISWCSSNPFTFLGHLFDLLDVFFFNALGKGWGLLCWNVWGRIRGCREELRSLASALELLGIVGTCVAIVV